MAKSKEAKRKEAKKNEELKKQAAQKEKEKEQQNNSDTQITPEMIGAIIGAIIGGSVLGSFTYSMFVNDKNISDTNNTTYKWSIGLVAVLVNAIIPGIIGWYAGASLDTASIIYNILSYLGVYGLLLLVFRNLLRPNTFDTLICSLIVIFSFLLSIKFGVYNDGSFSGFWIIILFIFSLLLVVYYYFGFIVKSLRDIQDIFLNSNSKELSTNIYFKTVDNPSKLLFNLYDYNSVFNKVFEIINPNTVPKLVPTINKIEPTIDIAENQARFALLACVGLVFGIIMLISIIIYFFDTIGNKIVPENSNLFSSSLTIMFWLLLFVCIFLYFIKQIIEETINTEAPQLLPQNLDTKIDEITQNVDIKTKLLPIINNILNSTDLTNITNMTNITNNPNILELQKLFMNSSMPVSQISQPIPILKGGNRHEKKIDTSSYIKLKL